MRRFSGWLSAAVLGTFLLTGCGGGSTTGTASPSRNVTRSSAQNFTKDALILAARESTSDAWIPETLAKNIDADLSLLRSRFSNLGTINARPDHDLYTLIVNVENDAPWRAKWEAGTLTTGETELDTLLTNYKAKRVEKIGTYDSYTTFVLHFEDPLNPKALESRFTDSTEDIEDCDPNGIVGDGNRIERELRNGTRIYRFSLGWGDCPSGCTYRRTYTATINADGTILLTESGDRP
jgi:hypothetical protein